MNVKYKVILVKTDTRPVEKLMNDGWQPKHVFPHPTGAIFIMVK